MVSLSFINYWSSDLGRALGETLYLVFFATIASTIIGFILAIILYLTRKDGLRPCRPVYEILNLIINIFRSFPFIILALFLMPFTREVMSILTGRGTSTGDMAALIPLTVGAAPFVARVIENAFIEVDKGMIEAARSLGLRNYQIIFKVVVPEAIPAMVSGLTLSIVSIVGFTAMAGAVGANGLGALALTKGMFDYNLLIYTVVLIILLVQVIQLSGNLIYKKIK